MDGVVVETSVLQHRDRELDGGWLFQSILGLIVDVELKWDHTAAGVRACVRGGLTRYDIRDRDRRHHSKSEP